MISQQEIYGNTVEMARFLRKYGKFLCEYGQIIQKKGNRITMS